MSKRSPRSPPADSRTAMTDTAPTVQTTLILLGTGMPRPDPMCSGPASAVVVGGQVFLFDAGPGVMRRMAAAGLPIDGVDALFLTHLHSDHTLGYPDLIFTSWVMGRREPLQAYGPKGLRRMTKHILEAWKEDVDVRITGLEQAAADGYQVDVHEIVASHKSVVVYERDGVRISAFPVRHGSWKHAFGYRIDTADRSIVISGDTRPCDTLLDAARGVDILLHEVYPDSGLAPELREGGEEWPSYMREFHTSDLELGAIAAVAQPRLLVLHHIVRMGSTDAELLAAIRAGGFTGETVIGQDLDWF